jgi:hypothetical protein
MKKEHRPLVWLVINAVLLGSSLFMTWFMLGVIDTLWPFSGWEFIFMQFFSAFEEFQNHNFQWYWFVALLEGIGGLFVIGYILFIIMKAAKRKIFAGSKTRSIVLAIIATVFLLSNLGLGSYLGYWLFMAGLISNAILEWQYSRLPVDLLTGKRTRKQ